MYCTKGRIQPIFYYICKWNVTFKFFFKLLKIKLFSIFSLYLPFSYFSWNNSLCLLWLNIFLFQSQYNPSIKFIYSGKKTVISSQEKEMEAKIRVKNMLRTSSSGNLKFRVWDWYNIIIYPLLSISTITWVGSK